MRTPMIDEHNVVAVSRFDGDTYKSSHAAELTLNAAILRAEIARSYEEFLAIFEMFYADAGLQATASHSSTRCARCSRQTCSRSSPLCKRCCYFFMKQYILTLNVSVVIMSACRK